MTAATDAPTRPQGEALKAYALSRLPPCGRKFLAHREGAALAAGYCSMACAVEAAA